MLLFTAANAHNYVFDCANRVIKIDVLRKSEEAEHSYCLHVCFRGILPPSSHRLATEVRPRQPFGSVAVQASVVGQHDYGLINHIFQGHMMLFIDFTFMNYLLVGRLWKNMPNYEMNSKKNLVRNFCRN